MKKHLLTIILIILGSHFAVNQAIPSLERYNNAYVLDDEKYNKFISALKIVKKWEGNYAYLEHDKGGETYCGITRNFNKKWEGWKLIDEVKKKKKLEWNSEIPEVEKLVFSYYFKRWFDEGYYLINESFVANYLFDYRNTGPVAIKHIQLVLIEHGFKIELTKKMDRQTIDAINKINPSIFILHIQEMRRDFYINVVDRNPELEIYLKGWLNRANELS